MKDIAVDLVEGIAFVPLNENGSDAVLESVQEEIVQSKVADDSILLDDEALRSDLFE